MSKALFVQRRDGRVAAMQFIYAWSMNTPVNLANDLVTFFEGCEEPREHYNLSKKKSFFGIFLYFLNNSNAQET